MTGRTITEADVEPGTWALAESGRAVTGVQILETLHAAARLDPAGPVLVARRRVRPAADPDARGAPARARRPNPIDGDPAMATILQTPYAAFAAGFNVTGQPAASIPLGTGSDGLPIGVQLVAAHHREDVLFRVAGQLERATPWGNRRPPVFAG